MSLKHNEAKETAMSESGGERGLLQGPAEKQGGQCRKKPEAP